MKCPKCKFENREAAQYCLDCGERLGFTCLKCRNALTPEAKFCDNCGQDLKELDEFKFGKGTTDDLLLFLSVDLTLKEAKNRFEESFLRASLEKFDWNVSRTAEAIGIERSHLYRKMKTFCIEPLRDDK